MRDLRTPLAAAIGISLCLGAMPVDAQQAALKMTLFGQPSVNNDSIWMAFEKGLYQQEGLDVTYRLFPSGTTAFQAFQTGQGDIVMTGDLPSVQYFFRAKGDYRTIAVIERDAKGYVAVARKEITKPQDLVGKTVATRVGSTGSWFISEYPSPPITRWRATKFAAPLVHVETALAVIRSRTNSSYGTLSSSDL